MASSTAGEICRRIRCGGKEGQARVGFEESASSSGSEEEARHGPQREKNGAVRGDGADDGVLDVLARFRGDRKECKFIVVTGACRSAG